MTSLDSSGIIVGMFPEGSKASSDASLERVLLKLQSLTPEERAEMLLGYFVRLIAAMDDATLLAFRSVCTADIAVARETLIEVIDGHLALRRIDRGSLSTAEPDS